MQIKIYLTQDVEYGNITLMDRTNYCPTFIFPIFHNALNAGGYQASCWQDGGCRKLKEDTVNKFSKQDFISITLWHRYSRQSGVYSTFSLRIYDSKSNKCVTKELFNALTKCSPAKFSRRWPFSQPANFAGRQPALSDNPAIIQLPILHFLFNFSIVIFLANIVFT